jgi:tetratricopeptide (TPR) repeat protein
MKLVLVALLAAAPAAAQIPDRFTNLQILPKDIERRALIDRMRGFAVSLGVRCEHCHVGDGGPMLENMDFSSDDKEPKRTARVMLRMVEAINGEHLARLGKSKPLTVECFTCHRGVSRPEPIQSIVESALTGDGIEGAGARYRELRKTHYGSASYDFTEGPLNHLGEGLLRNQKSKEALAVLALNLEFYPESAWTHHLLGEAHLAAGDREAARASFEKSLARDPRNPMTQKRLKEMKK